MLKQIEGSQGIAAAVALCRPDVICAYPITPQTHIVEDLSVLVKSGKLKSEYINVESEFAALSVAIGASSAGVRSYTATSSQGLLFMSEAVYNASGMELPIVMTLGNRAIGAPINIWNDHSDAMAMRGAGWIMLFAENNQEAADLHIQAFRIAEVLRCPVMVCVDGFVLTHANDRIDIPTQDEVDAFLPAFSSDQALDPAHPCSIGAMVGPEAFTEVRYLAHMKQQTALLDIPRVADEFYRTFQRHSGGLLRGYCPQDAEIVVVSMGSITGTIKETIDEERAVGHSIGSLNIVSFRPFPADDIRKALRNTRSVVVVDRAIEPGDGGPVFQQVQQALIGEAPKMYSVIAGLGGRAVTRPSLHRFFDYMRSGIAESPYFLDLDTRTLSNFLSAQQCCSGHCHSCGSC
jgi:pyruvate ferredoxin oxidoreductase alpha subunit